LEVLVVCDEAVPVSRLADRLRVSRRTVFRELGDVAGHLAPYGLTLGTVVGRGVCLVGEPAGRVRLAADLAAAVKAESSDRHVRLPRLALILVEGGTTPAKLASYGHDLGVSEATLSHDFAKLEPILAGFGLRIVRRQGRGVHAEGGELATRQTIAWARQELRDLGSAPARSAVTTAWAQAIDWTTPESALAVADYLAVSVDRIRSGHGADHRPGDPAHRAAAADLASLVAASEQVVFDEAELEALSVFLAASRRRGEPSPRVADQDRQALAGRLIEAFDPGLAPVLKLDEDLLSGLTHHLESALVRIERHIWLTDPLAGQMRAKYPEIMARSARAAALLAPNGETVPESETSFLAAHFGAAVHRLDERGVRRRTLRLGVVCPHGIGSSYLLAAQLERQFGAVARVEVSDAASVEEYDLLVATVPLTGTKVPVIEVSPVLDEAAVQRIRAGLATARRAPRDAARLAHGPLDLAATCSALAAMCADILSILTQFASLPVAADSTLEQLARLAGYRFGADEDSGRIISQDLLAREQVTSQVIPELRIVLLHARSAGVASPVFALLTPTGGVFRDPHLQGARAVVLMLVPPQGDTALMGSLSSALVKTDDFLGAVVDHHPDRVLAHVHDILHTHLIDDFHTRLKG
jgi:mannitol operon transcriptional antiterminator